MPRTKETAPADRGTYTPRDDQETMLGLSTREPERVAATPEAALARDISAGLVDPGVRLRRVVNKYRAPRVPEGQMGLGVAFGASVESSHMQLGDLFARRK
jgi:hypothetical protein